MNKKDTELKKKFEEKFKRQGGRFYEARDILVFNTLLEEMWDFIHSAVEDARKEGEIKGFGKGYKRAKMLFGIDTPEEEKLKTLKSIKRLNWKLYDPIALDLRLSELLQKMEQLKGKQE